MRDLTGSNKSFFAQRRPRSGFETIYTAHGGEILYYINVANVEAANCTWSVCISNGKPYGRNNAIVWQEDITANDNDVWGYQIPLIQGQRIGVRSSNSRALNFTVYGFFG